MENRNIKTHSLIEASIISAIIVVMMVITGYVPVISLVGTFILPIPITILCIRHNYKIALSAIFVSAVLSSAMFSAITAVIAAFTYGSVGIILAYCIKTNKKVYTSIFFLALDSIAVIFMNIIITLIFTGEKVLINSIQSSIDMTKEILLKNKEILIQNGASLKQLEDFDKYINLINVDMALTMLFSGLFIAAIVSAYINYGVLSYILKKFKIKIEDNIPLSKIYIPNTIVAFFIVVVCIGIILTTRNIYAGKYIQISGLYVLGFLLLIDGVAVSVYYLTKRYKISKAIIVLIVVFSFLTPFYMVYIYIAAADIIFDFRKLDPNRLIKR